MAAEGQWMDGESAVASAASLTLADGHLVVSSADGGRIYARWPLARVRVDALHEGGVFHLESLDDVDALVTTRDEPFALGISRVAFKATRLPHGRSRSLLVVTSLISVVVLFLGLYFGAPVLSQSVARAVPVEVERRLAPEVHALFEKTTCEGPGARRALRTLLHRLDPDDELRVDLRLVNLDGANAFAMPGGVVVLTRGLVEEATGPDEVAGVLAHELAHVQHRHALAHMIRNVLLGAIWAVSLGEYSGLLVIDPKTAYDIATLRFSREAEAEADQTASRTLAESDVPVQGLIDFFERHRLDALDKLSWASSHPAVAERMRALSKAERTGAPRPVMSTEAFYQLRTACESTPRVDSVKDLFD